MVSVSQKPTVTEKSGGASSSWIHRRMGDPSRGAALTSSHRPVVIHLPPNRSRMWLRPALIRLGPADCLCLQCVNPGLDPPAHLVDELHGVSLQPLISLIGLQEGLPHLLNFILDVGGAVIRGHGDGPLGNRGHDLLDPRGLLFSVHLRLPSWCCRSGYAPSALPIALLRFSNAASSFGSGP